MADFIRPTERPAEISSKAIRADGARVESRFKLATRRDIAAPIYTGEISVRLTGTLRELQLLELDILGGSTQRLRELEALVVVESEARARAEERARMRVVEGPTDG